MQVLKKLSERVEEARKELRLSIEQFRELTPKPAQPTTAPEMERRVKNDFADQLAFPGSKRFGL